MNRKLEVCTIATPTIGLFSLDAMREALSSLFLEVESLDLDLFATLLNDWCDSRSSKPNLTDAGFNRGVAEILRSSQVYGDEATTRVRGRYAPGVRLQFDIGSKIIVARFPEVVGCESPDACGAIDRVKEAIANTHPHVEFKDIPS